MASALPMKQSAAHIREGKTTEVSKYPFAFLLPGQDPYAGIANLTVISTTVSCQAAIMGVEATTVKRLLAGPAVAGGDKWGWLSGG